MTTAGSTTQRRNRFSFLVTWPGDSGPDGEPKSYRVYAPTLPALDVLARGYEIRGAAVTNGQQPAFTDDGRPNPYMV